MSHPTLNQIKRHTAAAFGTDYQLMAAADFTRRLARARQAAMYLAREMTAQSLPQIGRSFKRDHTTVLYSVRRIEELRADSLTLSLRLHIARWSLEFLEPYTEARNADITPRRTTHAY